MNGRAVVVVCTLWQGGGGAGAGLHLFLIYALTVVIGRLLLRRRLLPRLLLEGERSLLHLVVCVRCTFRRNYYFVGICRFSHTVYVYVHVCECVCVRMC